MSSKRLASQAISCLITSLSRQQIKTYFLGFLPFFLRLGLAYALGQHAGTWVRIEGGTDAQKQILHARLFPLAASAPRFYRRTVNRETFSPNPPG